MRCPVALTAEEALWLIDPFTSPLLFDLHAMLRRLLVRHDADMGGVDARLEFELVNNILAQLQITHLETSVCR